MINLLGDISLIDFWFLGLCVNTAFFFVLLADSDVVYISCMENSIDIWDAIREMRALTGKGKTFSMVFMSYDKGRKMSKGAEIITRAKLRPGTNKEQNRNADYMLNFLDVDKNLPRQMYQICLMEFNGKRIRVT